MISEIHAKEVAALQARLQVYREAAALAKDDPYRVVEGVCTSHLAIAYLDALAAKLTQRITDLSTPDQPFGYHLTR